MTTLCHKCQKADGHNPDCTKARPVQHPAANSEARKRIRDAAFAPIAVRGEAVDAAVDALLNEAALAQEVEDDPLAGWAAQSDAGKGRYEACVLDAEGNCRRWTHNHAPARPDAALTDAERQAVQDSSGAPGRLSRSHFEAVARIKAEAHAAGAAEVAAKVEALADGWAATEASCALSTGTACSTCVGRRVAAGHLRAVVRDAIGEQR